MIPALRLPQAVRSAVPFALEQTRKPLRRVKIEVPLRHHPFQPQEILHPLQLHRGVHHQPLPANKQELRQREVLEPPGQIARVNPEFDRPPGRVHDAADGAVEEDELLEGLHIGLLGHGLGVVGDGARDGVAHDDEEFSGGIHVLHAAGRLLGDEVRWGFFDGELALEGGGHALAVPLEAARVVLVEEVHLAAGGAHVGVDADELEEGASTALFYTYETVFLVFLLLLV